MVSAEGQITTTTGLECDDNVKDTIIKLVAKGGEVSLKNLTAGIRERSAHLFYVARRGKVSVAGALKNPLEGYRENITEKAGFELGVSDFPLELGYIYVDVSERKKGFGGAIVEAALNAANGAGVFATTRVSNEAMQKLLPRYGFTKVGQPYLSDSGDYELVLMVHPARR